MNRNASTLAPAACLAVLLMLWLPGLPLAAASERFTVAQFSDGSSEATFYFGASPETNQTTVSISRKAVIGSAGLSVEGLPGRDGEYPAEATLRIGTKTVWDFGAELAQEGQMGRQTAFTGERESLSFWFPQNGGAAADPGLLLPTAAVLKEASVEISGAPGLLQPVVYSRPSSGLPVFWGAGGAEIVSAEIAGDSVVFNGRDPETGAILRSRSVSPGLSAGAFVEDIQYLAESDRAGLLVPGRGVLVVNLTNGREEKYFNDTDAYSIAAMRLSEEWLAVLGRGWAAVHHFAGGAEDRVDAAEFPAAAWYEPVAVDYHPGTRRLFMASRGSSFSTKAISVFQLERRTMRLFSDASVTSILASVLYVPERDCLLLGMGGTGSVNGVSNNQAVVAMSLADGAISRLPAFEELGRGLGLRRQGDAICAIGGQESSDSPTLVVVDAKDWSWKTFPGGGTDWGQTRYWAYDPAARRLATSSYNGGVEVFALDFALGSGAGWMLPDPLAPVPGQVRAVLAQGDDIVTGTGNGLSAIGPDGRRSWTIDCGRVDALARDPVSGRLVAAALGGLRCEPGDGLWDRRTLELPELDLSTTPPANTGRSVELPKDWSFATIRAVAPCQINGTVFLSVYAPPAMGLYELWPNGTFVRVQTPSMSVGALALSPDGRTLYAACSGAGLLVLDISTGAQELVTPFSESPLLSPYIASIEVDESGGVLVGQWAGSNYFPGGISLLERSANGTLETVFGREFHADRVQSCVRDRAGGRILIAAGTLLAVINTTDGTRTDLSPGVYLTSLDWSPGSRLLAGSGAGSAIRLGWTEGSPSNLTLDMGGDGRADWSGPGRLEGAVRVDLTSALAGFLASRPGASRFTAIPVSIGSGSGGLVQLRSLSVVFRLSERVDLREALEAYLRALPASEEARVPLSVSAVGGGLRLHGLGITYEAGAAPRPRSIPAIQVDARASAPRMVDLSKYFADDVTPSGNLTFRLDVKNPQAGVGLSLVFGRYLLIDAREAKFRGDIRATVTASDSSGLPASSELTVRVFRTGEYVPPPPYYNTLAWVFGAVVLALGLVALRLYLRAFRKRE